jgi:hypothetical protein
LEEKNKVILYSNYKIDISEAQDDDSYMNVKFIICNFDINKNNVMLNRDTILNWLNTLIMKPLVGLIKTNKDNELDFTSHEAKRVTEIINGSPQETVKFGTEAFGVFDNVQIVNIDGIDYIQANCRVWKRFANCCQIIQDRFNNNEPLNTSWEIAIVDSNQKVINGQMVKVINDGVFIGHALLSKYTIPAYDCSGMLEVAEKQNEEDTELMKAFIDDLNNINQIAIANNQNISNQTDKDSVDNKLNNNENFQCNEGGNKRMINKKKSKQIENSSLTIGDVYQAVYNALWDSEYDPDTVIIHPVEQEILVHQYGDLDENYIQIPYTMNDDGTVTLGDGTPVTMVFMPQSDYDTQMAQLTVAKEKVTKELSSLKGNIKTKDNEISELNNKLKEKETELSAKISSIVDLGKNISDKETVIAQKEELLQDKETEIAELLPFKAQVEEINAEKTALEIAEKKEAFKNEYLSTKLISEKDLEIAEVKEAIETMDDSKMKIFIAQKVIEKAKTGKSQTEIEVSEVKDQKVEINLNSTNSNDKEFNFADCWK